VERGEVMKMVEWPEVLYMTPDKWSFFGDVFVVDQKGLFRMVCSLCRSGNEVNIDDARPIRLVHISDDERAIYEGWDENRKRKLYRVRRYRFPDGEVAYDWCEYPCEEEEE
jgi:hypothetical protein